MREQRLSTVDEMALLSRHGICRRQNLQTKASTKHAEVAASVMGATGGSGVGTPVGSTPAT